MALLVDICARSHIVLTPDSTKLLIAVKTIQDQENIDQGGIQWISFIPFNPDSALKVEERFDRSACEDLTAAGFPQDAIGVLPTTPVTLWLDGQGHCGNQLGVVPPSITIMGAAMGVTSLSAAGNLRYRPRA